MSGSCATPLDQWSKRPPQCEQLLDLPDGRLGQQERLAFTDTEKTIINARSNSQRAEVVNVALGLQFDTTQTQESITNDEGDLRAPVRARISWGQGGASFEAFCDWRNGMQLSIPASRVEIAAVYEEQGTDPDEIFPNVILNAALTWGSRASRSFVTRTLPKVEIGAGATTRFAVPPFAYSVFLFCDDIDSLAPSVAFQGATNPAAQVMYGNPAITDLRAQEMLATDGVKLPGHARAVAVTNTDGAARGYTVMFGLNL